MNNKDDELIPLDRVLDDMYNPYSGIQYEARKYYYDHYATEEERKEMDREYLITNITCYITLVCIILVLFVSIFLV